MAKSRKKTPEIDVYTYSTKTKVILIIITVLLGALIPVTALDKGAWLNSVPVIMLVLIPIVLYFIWIIWQDSPQKITITREGIRWEKGAWRFRKDLFIPWENVLELRDSTTIFSISRKFCVVSNEETAVKIQLSSALQGYRDLLNKLIPRLPRETVNERAKKALTRMRIKNH